MVVNYIYSLHHTPTTVAFKGVVGMSMRVTLTLSDKVGKALKNAATNVGKEPGMLAREWVESKMLELGVIDYK